MSFDRSQMAKVANTWKSVVVDFTKRNNLLFFKPKTATLDLTCAPVAVIDQLLADTSVSLKALTSQDSYEDAQKVATKLLTKQKHLLEELGVSPIFLALGFCSWIESEASGNTAEEKTTKAPVFLLQLELENKRSSQDGWKLKPVAELKVNGVIAHAANAAGIKFDEDSFLELLPEVPKVEDLVNAFELLRDALKKLDSFFVSQEIHLAAFGYQSESIYRDLSDIDGLMDSEIVRALAGDSAAITKMQRDPGLDVSMPDYVDPKLENLILDADASQIETINIAMSATTVVVEGPPGTGKSQTIANLLAESLAAGKKVLFVAQKRAAITAVLSRLASKGLDSLVLDLHDAGKGPQVASQLRSSYENMRTSLPVEVESVHKELVEARSKLVSLKDAFTSDIRGLGLTLEGLQGLHYETDPGLRPDWRLDTSALSAMSAETFKDCSRALSQIVESQGFRGDFATRSDSWNVDLIRTQDDIVRTAEKARHFCNEQLLDLKGLPLEAANKSSSAAEFYAKAASDVYSAWLWVKAPKLMRKSPTLMEVQDAITVFSGTETSIGWLAKLKIRLRIGLLISGDDRQRLTALQMIYNLKSDGLGVEVSAGEVSPGAAEKVSSVQALKDLLAVVQGFDSHRYSIDEFASHLLKLCKDNSQFRIAAYWGSVAAIGQLGLGEALTQLKSLEGVEKLSAEEVVSVFSSSAAISLVEEAMLQDERLRGMDADSLASVSRAFQIADRKHLRQNARKILRLAAENFQTAINAHQQEHHFLHGEASKKRAHKPLRELVKRAPNLMLAANPIWAMSPIQVASLLPRISFFDLVIFDEASQIRPEMAIPAIMRAKTAVVAGDSNQLPPTNFFAGAGLLAGEEDEERFDGVDNSVTQNTLKDSESILEAMERVVGTRKKRLLWHYRSRDERLIALSNIEIYGNTLTTFPASDTPDALRHVLVKTAKNKTVATGSQNNEALEVIELIREHAKTHPAESLGVITFGIKHLEKLEMALAQARRDDPTLDSWFDSNSDEPFFLKNLERVQGDERDAIIISTGYGKDENGRMNMQWGPLTSEDGRRRLNVAISRAKRRMTLVSNFTLADLSDVKVREGTGVELYKKFLDYVSNDGAGYSNASSTVPMNSFELDIKRRLEMAGLNLVPQFGVCNYRIDFAVRNPNNLDEFLLAIEADGASYHSGHIARERDRLRQMLLEDRGWNFHRIWSTDWFSNPDREVERTLAAYNAAIQKTTSVGTQANARSSDLETLGDFKVSTEPTRTLSHPGFGYGRPITDYTPQELDSIVRFIVSDGLLRSDDEIIEEASKEILGFSRTRSRIKTLLLASIRRVQR